MNNLGVLLEKLCARDFSSQRELSTRLETSHTNLRQMFAGQRCSRELLKKLLGVFSDPEDRWALVTAHLLDECDAAGLDSNKLVVRSTEGVSLRELRLSIVYEDYLGIIARRLQAETERSEKLRPFSEQVEWLAEMIEIVERHEAAAAAAKADGKLYSFPAASDLMPGEHPQAAYVAGPKTKL